MTCPAWQEPPDYPARGAGCNRCGRLREAHQTALRPPRAVKHLGPCDMCGRPFRVDLDWWLDRVRQGLPEIAQCQTCHAYAHHGAPPVQT